MELALEWSGTIEAVRFEIGKYLTRNVQIW